MYTSKFHINNQIALAETDQILKFARRNLLGAITHTDEIPAATATGSDNTHRVSVPLIEPLAVINNIVGDYFPVEVLTNLQSSEAWFHDVLATGYGIPLAILSLAGTKHPIRFISTELPINIETVERYSHSEE